ncbi:MAG: DUF1211 domain-containing protein [Actinobacteria bacterium]|nr:DUF1211 domain-containing protein [Actinomycetota bacterium]MBO0833907.1 DUF1211 domain-containing protein [Actinomycetota bacterium]
MFFSDAVVAIAITLLALGLPVPQQASSDLSTWHALLNHRAAYVAFLISFVVIGAHWRSHHRLFRSIARLDSSAIALNMVWLLMIIVTPYATRVLSGNGGFGVRFSLYAAVQVVTLVMIWTMSRHIRRSGLRRRDAPAGFSALEEGTVLAVAAVFAISIPIAFIPHVDQWAFAVWVAAVVVLRWVRRVQAWTTKPRS